MQLEDTSIRVILEYELINEKPMLAEIDQTNYSVKALWYQWNDLEDIDRILYRKRIDQKRNLIFQLVAPDPIRDLIFTNLHSPRTAGHFGRDRTIGSIQRRYYGSGHTKDISRWVKATMQLTHEFTFKHLGVAITRQKAYYDRGLNPRVYEIGDWVWRF